MVVRCIIWKIVWDSVMGKGREGGNMGKEKVGREKEELLDPDAAPLGDDRHAAVEGQL